MSRYIFNGPIGSLNGPNYAPVIQNRSDQTSDISDQNISTSKSVFNGPIGSVNGPNYTPVTQNLSNLDDISTTTIHKAVFNGPVIGSPIGGPIGSLNGTNYGPVTQNK